MSHNYTFVLDSSPRGISSRKKTHLSCTKHRWSIYCGCLGQECPELKVLDSRAQASTSEFPANFI